MKLSIKKIFKLCKWSLPGFIWHFEFPGRHILHLTFHNVFLKKLLLKLFLIYLMLLTISSVCSISYLTFSNLHWLQGTYHMTVQQDSVSKNKKSKIKIKRAWRRRETFFLRKCLIWIYKTDNPINKCLKFEDAPGVLES